MVEDFGMREEDLIIIGVTMAISFFLWLVITIVSALILQSVLNRVPQQYRAMSPALVWLVLIPCFNYVWNFFIVVNVTKSLQNYFHSQNRFDVGGCGFGVGLGAAIAYACTIIPLLNYLAFLVCPILLIIFLVQVSGLKNQIPVQPVANAYAQPF